MTVRQLVFFAKPTFEELMSRIKHELDWNDESVGMQGRYDVGGGVMSHKFMLDLNGEIEWQTYIDIVLGSHFKSLEVFAWKKDGRIGKKELIDLNESPLIESPISCHELSERCSRKEELIEEDVEGGEGVNDMADVEVREENDPVREEVHAEENVPLREEVHAEDNVPLREEVNVEENVPVREEGDVEDGREVGDDVELPEEEANAKNVSMGLRELARLKFYTREECEEAMIRSGLNPGWLEYDTEDELDESASDSDDDRPVRKMSEHERTVFAKLVGRNPEITQFEDLTRSGLAIADGDPQYDGAFEPMCDEPRKGLEFRSMDDLKIWLQSYSIRVHRPYHVKESNASVKYTVACLDRHCKWQINVRKSGGDRWRVTRVGEDHTCCSAEVTGKHLQLTSRFIGNRLQAFVRAEPTLSPAAIVEAVEQIWHYRPTYGKAWRAKQVAMKVIWGDWDEAYVRLPTLMRAIKAKNPTMHFRVEAHPEKSRMVDGVQRRVFGRAYWIFGQSIEAFKHLRPVLAIDGTFLTGKYQGTLLTAIGVDAGLHLVPLAFALVEKENTSNWEWFINMLRNKLIGPNREVCIISDRHPGILNSIIHIMPHHLTIHHRWCMRHFCANFYTAGATTDQMKDLERICQINEKALFLDEIKRLMGVVGERPKKWLEDHMPLKVKWARAFDTNGRRHSIMTSNMAESFNNVLRGIRKLPVTAIVAYTFSKCNSWFVDRHKEATVDILCGKKWPTKVKDMLEEQQRRTLGQRAACFDFPSMKYEVSEQGGVTAAGVQWGGRHYVVVARDNTCSCQFPQLHHLPCSHMITVCMLRGLDVEVAPRMCYEASNKAVQDSYSPRFEPYLDPSQWPSYDGEFFVPDLSLKNNTRGRRRTRRMEHFPGLEDFYEEKHRAPQIASGERLKTLRVRGHTAHILFDDRYVPYLRRAKLLAFVTMAQRPVPLYNAAALTALVDRWRPETHTFHLPCGELTVTLEDVAMILGLPIRGQAVTGDTASGNWRERVEEYLGLEPPVAPDGQRQTKTSGVPLSWLRANFGQCPAEADEATVQRYCRAYVLYIFGSILFPDSGGDMASWMWLPLLADWDEAGTFSWGSAALAWLYRQLCDACRRQGGDANLAGCVWLLQVWMWMRLPVGRPMWRTHQAWPHQDADRRPTVAHLWESVPSPVVGRRNLAYYHYTNEMDYLQPEHVVWMPYQAQEVLELELNPMCHIEDALKTLRCPLICFYAVEFQMCHRVMRQFGRLQTIPHRFSTSIDLHKVDRRKNKKVTDWAYYHQDHITQWEKFEENGVPDQGQHNGTEFDLYLAWLHRTYRLVLRPAWTLADIADDPEDVEEQNEYDTRTRLGTTVETGPVRDRVARELLRTVNDAGVALGTAPGSEGEGGTLRNALQRLRQRCRKLAARLGCRSTDVVEHAHAHQEGDEEGEVGDEEGEQDKEAEEGDEEEEGDEDREEEADELGPSQLEDAPESSQPDILQPGPSRPRRRRAPSQDWRYTPDVPRPRTRVLLKFSRAGTSAPCKMALTCPNSAPVHLAGPRPKRPSPTSAPGWLALSFPQSAPFWLALRSQPASHPEGLLGWAKAETAKSHLSARLAGAEFPTVSAILASAEVPARKPSRRLASLGQGRNGQVPPQRQSQDQRHFGWR
ncbi:Os07g0513300 [Oryza sativa Japonica Group]|uniref:Os07g0513300 protein n=1 Tax=Oryza sativa subsp. japonica TaxID=39947 RepID=C7J4V8_ORYSJ|nr:Os07g0513300 [Oryza sativa Japonica Group]|eukprot:NP_001175221.1 Os07g0513300 [Oryza sativa Japonica Group]